MKVFIIVPVYNEQNYLDNFLKKLKKITKNIIVVDDGSLDKTCYVAKKNRVTVLSHMTNLGKGAALKTGCDYAFKYCHADAVIIMDGDDQHSVLDLKKFTDALAGGAEIVQGIRTLDKNMPLSRQFGNKTISYLIRVLYRKQINDIPSGFKAMTKAAYKKLRWHSSGYEVETEIAVRVAKSKMNYAEVPISTIYHDKEYGFNLLDAAVIMIKIPFWIWS